ncbi:MAG: cyclic nucleotide-binding domain-containing protein [Chloroflexi bacterium]|nr:cyclic nucleotide-binding domain-containing protein [Chloroflexota bacterium]
MPTDTFELFSDRVWARLGEQSRRVTYRRGEIILKEGDYRKALYLIRRGIVRVEQSQHGQGIALAQLGPGEIFGEMGFVENTSASASVIAQEDSEVDVVEDANLQSLLATVPGFAVRFFQSLAISLARRLRSTSTRLAQASTVEAAQVNAFRSLRTGNVTAQQIPTKLAAAVDTFKSDLAAIDQGLHANRLAVGQAQTQVDAACDDLIDHLRQYTQPEVAMEAGWDDLLAFREPEQIELGLGDYVFRSVFPVLMLGSTLARAYTKPRGYPEDYETMRMLYRNEPEGDERLGPFIDQWFLNRPLASSRRASCRAMTEYIVQLTSRYPRLAPGSGHEPGVRRRSGAVRSLRQP